jgi:hypothetical protein
MTKKTLRLHPQDETPNPGPAALTLRDVLPALVVVVEHLSDEQEAGKLADRIRPSVRILKAWLDRPRGDTAAKWLSRARRLAGLTLH